MQISDKLRSSCSIPHSCILMLSMGPQLLRFYPGWRVDPLNILHHPRVAAAVADLSSGSPCGATRAFAAGTMKVLDDHGIGPRSCGDENEATPIKQPKESKWLWKHPQIDMNRPLVVFSFLYLPQTKSFIPNGTDSKMFQSLWNPGTLEAVGLQSWVHEISFWVFAHWCLVENGGLG